MSAVEDLLKKVQAQLDKTSSEFSQKAEAALKEAKDAGTLSAETKTEVDKLATSYNALNLSVDKLKADLGEAEQVVTALKTGGGRGARADSQTPGQIVAASDSVKVFAKNVSAGRRVSVDIPQAALMTADLPPGAIEPHRIPGVDGRAPSGRAGSPGRQCSLQRAQRHPAGDGGCEGAVGRPHRAFGNSGADHRAPEPSDHAADRLGRQLDGGRPWQKFLSGARAGIHA